MCKYTVRTRRVHYTLPLGWRRERVGRGEVTTIVQTTQQSARQLEQLGKVVEAKVDHHPSQAHNLGNTATNKNHVICNVCVV